jgi:hypothetical protein
MAVTFNPFTGNLDFIDTTAAAGSDTEIQFNDGGKLAGDDGLVFNKTSNKLTTKGDVELNDGGANTLTLQTVTPTAARTISFPDATGTVGLVAGSSGQLLYNASGANAGASTLTYDGSILTSSGRFINSYNAAASAPAKAFTGTWFTGGTATTTKPQVLIEPSGATSTAWSTSGTGLGVNAASGFAGNLLDLQVNGTSQLSFTSAGQINLLAAGIIDFNGRVRLSGTANSGGCLISSNKLLGFSNSASAVSTIDVHLRRDASGVIGVRTGGDATAGSYAQLNAAVIAASTAYEVSTLPGTPVVGMIARVTDATAPAVGSTVTGGGAAAALCWYNGANWSVIGV